MRVRISAVPTMALDLYRRHGSHCPGGRRLHQMAYEADELRRGWKEVFLPDLRLRYAGRSVPAKKHGAEHLDRGESNRDRMAEGGLLGAKAKPVEPPIVAAAATDASPPRISIADAIRAYLAVREGAGIAPATVRKHRTFTKKLRSFSDERGYAMLDQFTSTDIDVFYACWDLGVRAKGKALGTLRGFFRFCMNQEWLVKNPVTSDLKPPLGASRVKTKSPSPTKNLSASLLPRGQSSFPRTGGAGLGLSIGGWIVEAHNGKILAESQVGAGATFRGELPLG